ncbi:hypothetical protein AMS68_001089 [Peltaster fructicola]|uniref:Uncharacterized protein n=1 Tax=Peltaster fructicola TaxID=286661 RepID=A0A6H0XLE7_9PEZI|nr:hypothetical protein AMS68_001089 [Peltaster fructicola]
MARKKAYYKKRIVRQYDQETLDEPYRRPSTWPGFHFFRELPCEIFNQICADILLSDTRIDPARTKPPGFLYSCRYVWLQAFRFYYGSNHFVIMVHHDSIDATTLYLNTILSKLNDPERRAVVPVRDFTGKAANTFGSLHLIMQYDDPVYNSLSLASLERVWRHSRFFKHNSMTVFGEMLQRMLEGSQTPCNSRVKDDFVVEWRGQQEQIRLREVGAKQSEEEQLRLRELGKEQEREDQRQKCIATGCPCVLEENRRCKNRGRHVKGLHDKIFTSPGPSESDSD